MEKWENFLSLLLHTSEIVKAKMLNKYKILLKLILLGTVYIALSLIKS